MRDIIQARLASGLTIVAGMWLLLSLRFIPVTGNAAANLLIAGVVIVVAGSIQLVWENTIPSWVVGFMAMWLFITSLAFGMSPAAAWNEAIVAVICLVLATWDGIEIEQARTERHAGT